MLRAAGPRNSPGASFVTMYAARFCSTSVQRSPGAGRTRAPRWVTSTAGAARDQRRISSTSTSPSCTSHVFSAGITRRISDATAARSVLNCGPVVISISHPFQTPFNRVQNPPGIV